MPNSYIHCITHFPFLILTFFAFSFFFHCSYILFPFLRTQFSFPLQWKSCRHSSPGLKRPPRLVVGGLVVEERVTTPPSPATCWANCGLLFEAAATLRGLSSRVISGRIRKPCGLMTGTPPWLLGRRGRNRLPKKLKMPPLWPWVRCRASSRQLHWINLIVPQQR